MRRPAAALLALGACTVADAPSTFPAAFRGTWADSPAACASPQVEVARQSLLAYGSACRLDELSPAAGGGVLVRLHCRRTDGSARDDLARLWQDGETLNMRVGDAVLTWTRCA